MKIIMILFILLNIINAKDKVILQLSWLHQFQFAGYYIAKQRGYYKDAGIDVEIKEFQFGMNLSAVLEKNQADFTIGRSSLLIDKEEGKDVVALFSAFQDSPLILLVREDSNIKTLNDLKNKRVMITDEAKNTASILAMLSSKKIYLNDLKVQKHSFNLDDLINYKTDAMASYISNEPIRLEDKGIKYKIFDPKTYDFNFYSDILYTSSSFIKKNPQLTKAFYEATIKGWEYAFNNIGNTAQLIYEKYNSQNKSLIHLVSEGEALKKLAFTNDTKKIGLLEKDRLQKIVDIYKVMGLMKRNINLDNFIYEQNKQITVNLKMTENELFLYTIITLVTLAILIFTTVYISIRRRWLHTTQKLRDEVERKTLQLKEQNLLDGLTKTRNRKAYIEKITEYLSLYKRYKKKFSLVMLDIDDFKKVNDKYGHKVGDKVLLDFVDIVNNHIRRDDTLFRVGGEEFIILLPETDIDAAKIVIENIRKNIEKELISKNNEIVTVSSGLTEVLESDTEDSIFTRADLLLYESKKNGKNRVSV